MTRLEFLQMLTALIQGWEIDLDSCRIRINPTAGYFERLTTKGKWVPCPIGTSGHKAWRKADMGQPPPNQYA